MRLIGIVLVLCAGQAAADPQVDALAQALPSGWKLRVDGARLVIWRPEKVRIAANTQWMQRSANIPIAAEPDSPEITMELTYRVEAKWTPQQHANARAHNAKIYAAITQARKTHRIDELRVVKGMPLPANDAEAARLEAYERDQLALRGKLLETPRCTLGSYSVFDNRYLLLDLAVEPSRAMRQAFAIVELVKRRCR